MSTNGSSNGSVKTMVSKNTGLHHHLWNFHPTVPSKRHELTFGQHAADLMKAALASWIALGVIVGGLALWLITSGFGTDPKPFGVLNLTLSCMAALQAFVLLIAAKRCDQISSAIAEHTEMNSDLILELLKQNTSLTEAVERLTKEVHAHVVRKG